MLFFSSSQPPSLILSFPPKLNSHPPHHFIEDTNHTDNLLHTLFSSNFSFVLFVFSLLAFSVSRHPCPIWPKLTQSTTPFPLTNLLCPPPSFVLLLHHLLLLFTSFFLSHHLTRSFFHFHRQRLPQSHQRNELHSENKMLQGRTPFKKAFQFRNGILRCFWVKKDKNYMFPNFLC